MENSPSIALLSRNDLKLRLADILREVIEKLDVCVNKHNLLAPGHMENSIKEARLLLGQLGLSPTGARLWAEYSEMFKRLTDVLISSHLAADASAEERELYTEFFGAYPNPDEKDETKEDREYVAFSTCQRLSKLARDILRTCEPEKPSQSSDSLHGESSRTEGQQAANSGSKQRRDRNKSKRIQAWLEKHLEEHQEEYETLQDRILGNESEAIETFRERFGPLELARRFSEQDGAGGDEGQTQSNKTTVQRQKLYQRKIKPLLNGQEPADGNDAWNEIDEILTEAGL